MVRWKPDVCIHSGNCVHQLLPVINPRTRPGSLLKEPKQTRLFGRWKDVPHEH
ncbi:MAG: (4Fe-4S)-binding protein [Bacteroidetes bacterium]|nr:(4Fe-4S)-binding protein [Bacteroidota bacterium]